MKLQKILISLISGMILLGLAGCAHYRAKPLIKLETKKDADAQNASVAMTYQVFSKSDCMKYLDRNILKKGYQPIHVAISNNTDRAFSFSCNNFNMPCADAQDVANQVHTNTVARIAGYGVSGVMTSPLLVPWLAAIVLAGPIGAILVPLAIVPITFITSAIVDGTGSAKANTKLDADFDRKAFHDQTIRPFDSINGLIFVPVDDYDGRDLTLTLLDLQHGDKVIVTCR